MADGRARWWFALRRRSDALRERHGRAFWIAHSIWALANGAGVAALAEHSAQFWAWVLGFLALVWLSTAFFCRVYPRTAGRRSLRSGLASYATRVLYQQTLFFLLPFYARSTTFASWNVVFTLALAALAVLACLDLTFDRWLRSSAAFAATFFFAVAYAALQLLLPLVARVPFGAAQEIALALALASTVALVGWPSGARRARRLLGALPAAALTLALFAAPRAVPPAPLRLASLSFEASSEGAALLRAVARVSAPVPVPVHVTVQWWRGEEALRTSRDVAITAHGGGFRVWDELAAARLGAEARSVRVELLTETGQLLGRGAPSP